MLIGCHLGAIAPSRQFQTGRQSWPPPLNGQPAASTCCDLFHRSRSRKIKEKREKKEEPSPIEQMRRDPFCTLGARSKNPRDSPWMINDPEWSCCCWGPEQLRQLTKNLAQARKESQREEKMSCVLVCLFIFRVYPPRCSLIRQLDHLYPVLRWENAITGEELIQIISPNQLFCPT